MARKTAVAGKTGGRGGAAATMIIVLGTIMAVAALPLCILVVVGMLPTIAAAIADRHRARYLARSVAALNLAGLVAPVVELLHVGMSLAGVQHVLGLPFMWLIMYGTAALGWLLDWAMPSMAGILVDLRADQMQRQLEARAKALVEAWGDEVAG